MYYVPDGTKTAGFYECSDCHNRFLSVKTTPTLACPACEEDADMELGPDEEMPAVKEPAKLLKIVEGDEVEKMDTLLSLAITGGNFEWI